MEHIAIREVRLKYGKTRRLAREPVRESGDAAKFFRSILPDNVQEHFMALYLDGAHQPIGYKVVTTGLANFCQVHPRECFQAAICLGACAVIFAHNHPSGSSDASPEDCKITKTLADAGAILRIKVLDHLIITDTNDYSFQAAGLIP